MFPRCRRPTTFDKQVYDNRVYQGFGNAHTEEELRFGPNIADWPKMEPLPENLLLWVVSVIRDPVTTTDELIPSGETASYRSNPLKLAEFTLSRKDPGYVARAKAVQKLESRRLELLAGGGATDDLSDALSSFWTEGKPTPEEFRRFITDTGLGSVIFAVKPGDGSAREQAASCQKVLGGQANIALEYATKRYRSNLINWGMLPFTIGKEAAAHLAVDDLIFIPGIRKAVQKGIETAPRLPHPRREAYAPGITAGRSLPGRPRHHPGGMPDQLLRQMTGALRCHLLPAEFNGVRQSLPRHRGRKQRAIAEETLRPWLSITPRDRPKMAPLSTPGQG